MAAPNIVNVSSIYGKTIGGTLNTSTTTNYLSCPSNKVLKINTIIISNIDGTNAANATCYFYDSSSNSNRSLATTVTVPPDSSLVVISKDTAIYLEESDQIRAGASANSDLSIVISYEEIDDA
tara:strand:+ start:70 stop:438 length:369 start_codon:yes stop_codon:yes gene_type:complete